MAAHSSSRDATAASKRKIASGSPNQTLYVTNLPDSKIRKADLRLSLYTLFSTYGPILDVIALLTPKMRGQAHIVFRDVNASTQAMRSLQGFEFFGKEMQIAYAKGTSHTIAKLSGTWKAKEDKTATAAGAVASASDLQRSVFGLPPSASGQSTATEKQLDLRPPENGSSGEAKSPQGLKRPRDESEAEDEDVSMDEDDDGDAPMDASSDEE